MISFINVENLFGTFTYKVVFKLDNGVTIIHGPNGSGKSTILKMISSLSENDFNIFFEIPFDKITFCINNSKLEIERLNNGGLLRFKKGDNEHFVDKCNYETKEFSDVNFESINRELHKFGAVRIGASRYEYNDGIYQAKELYELLIGKKEQIESPEWINDILDGLDVRYISANRLDVTNTGNKTRNITKVESFQEDLKTIFQKYETMYGAVSRTLDDSFPNRIIDLANSQFDGTPDENTLTERLSKLSELKSEFTKRGILVQKDTGRFLTKEISSDQIKDNETLKKFLHLFIEDNEKKFEVFDTLIQNIKSFESIFDSVFSGKKVQVSREHGFKVVMTEGTMKGDYIPVNSLSSGEQHYLVLFYELIFNTEINQLILIDEPELSLHVSWQLDMVNQFLDIALRNKTKFILATHSPSIMRNHKHLCEEV